MKLVKRFNNFLDTSVNINDDRLKTLDDRVQAIDSFLSGAPVIGDIFIETVPQGSLAHRTIIKPLPGHEFDADILLHVEPQSDWVAKDYIEELYKAFRTSGIYKDRVTRKSRCVRVQYAGDCHVDVVPFIERSEGSYYITNRNEGDEGLYEQTDPLAYNEWLDMQSKITKGNLIKAIRLMKWLRDYKVTFTCRSVILNILLAERVNNVHLVQDANYYSDVPTTLVHLLEDLVEYLEPHATMPLIADPACPGVDYNHRWDEAQYLNFRSKIEFYAQCARAAYDEADLNQSIKLWQDLFGTGFGDLPTKSLAALGSVFDGSQLRKADPGEQFIEDQFTLVPSPFTVKIYARTLKKDGYRVYDLPKRGNRVESNRQVQFTARTNVPGEYEVYWKVKNRGKWIAADKCYRGEITKGSLIHIEPTKYRGNHYVECYIVRNNVVVARAKQNVIIL